MELSLGYGSGFGSDYGRGCDYNYGCGCGCGCDCDCGYTDVSDYGCGYGCGYADGYGYGYSDSYTLHIPYNRAWAAYHYIKADQGRLTLRNGKETFVGEHLHENSIKLDQYGLHASLNPEDARGYGPDGSSVLTKVLVWGRVIVDIDKLVATDRKILEIMEES